MAFLSAAEQRLFRQAERVGDPPKLTGIGVVAGIERCDLADRQPAGRRQFLDAMAPGFPQGPDDVGPAATAAATGSGRELFFPTFDMRISVLRVSQGEVRTTGLLAASRSGSSFADSEKMPASSACERARASLSVIRS